MDGAERQDEAGSGEAVGPCGERLSWFQELRSLGALGQVWTLTVIVFCIARAVPLWPMLQEHDVDPWWFLVLDVGTAPTYGIGQAMGVKIIRDETRRLRDAGPWFGLLMVSFLAPYVYLLLSAGKLPGYVVGGIVGWIAIFGGLAVHRMLREVRLAPERTAQVVAASEPT